MTKQEWWNQHKHVVEEYYCNDAEVERYEGATKEWTRVDFPSWFVDSLYRVKTPTKTQTPTETGGSAYPTVDGLPGGMTLLDYFAGQALAAVIAVTQQNTAMTSDMVACEAYIYAQAMLAERKRRGL
jgi:hypothetical protein